MTIRDELDNAVYSTLSGGSALISELGGTAIYNLQAPDHADLPFVVFSHVSGRPENINPSNLYSQLYLVRAYASTQVKVRAVEVDFDSLLHKQSLTISGYTNFWMVRESDVPSTVENLPNGEKVYASGGYYRIRVDD